MTDPCCSARLSLGLLLALAPASGLAAQDAPPDHAAHHRFVLAELHVRGRNHAAEHGGELRHVRQAQRPAGQRDPPAVQLHGGPSRQRLADRTRPGAGYHALLPGRDRALRQRAFVLAQQHAGAPSRSPVPARQHSRQRRGGASPPGGRAAGQPPGGDHRVFHGGRAGVPVGGELSRISATASSRWPGRPDAGPTARSGSRRRSPRSRATRHSGRETTRRRPSRASISSAWSGPAG